MSTEKHIGEAKIKDDPSVKLNLIIKDGVITPEKLSSRIVEEVINPAVNEALTPFIEGAIKHRFLTEAEYQELVDAGEVESDVLYFTTENT